MTPARVPEAPLTPLSQGYVAIDIPSTVATFAIGSLPVESGPLPALHLSIPTDGMLDV